jgi:hypothetical protein
MTRPFVIVGIPGHRRVTMFQAALAAQGLPEARVIAWGDLALPGAPKRLLADVPDDAIFRIDSMGEDDDVERAMLRRGEATARQMGASVIDAAALAKQPYELGRINPPRQIHCGFLAVLAEIETSIQRDWLVVQPPMAIRTLFDKRLTSQRWAAHGIPVPDALWKIRTPDELRARMREVGWPAVYVKMAASSSASCLAVFTHTTDGEHAITTTEDTGKARYNTRKLQRVTAKRALDRLLGFLLDEGSQIERAIPKALLGGKLFDLRVLTIDGVPAFIVVRTSPHPITNLHLGGLRGSVDELRAIVPEAAWEAAMASCIAVQRETGAFHVGVDLMFEPGFTAHRVIEGNAFGDLLPNLERDGLDVYGWQIRRLLERA